MRQVVGITADRQGKTPGCGWANQLPRREIKTSKDLLSSPSEAPKKIAAKGH